MLRLCLVCIALMLAIPSAACRADPVEFSYSFNVTPAATISSGTGSVTFSLFSGDSLAVNPGDLVPIQAASLFTTSSASDPADTFHSIYTLSVNVRDALSQQDHDFQFSGLISGTLSHNASQLSARFDGPLSVSHALGNYMYTVSVEPEEALLMPPGSLADVLINANVTVKEIQTQTGGGSNTLDTPEPGTMLLGLLGGPVMYWFRRRSDPHSASQPRG